MALFPYVVGRGQRFYAVAETTQNTYVQPSAGDACKVLKTSFSRKQERKNRNDSRLTRSRIEHITGQTTTNVSIEMYVLPSGTAGTPPDCHPLLVSHFGTYANVSSTSDTYTPSDAQTAISTVSLTREFNAGTATTGIMAQLVSGFSSNMLKIDLKGGDEPHFVFEGEAYDMVSSAYDLNFASIAAGATTLTTRNRAATRIITDNGNVTRIQPKYAFGTNVGAGSGYTITDVTGSTWTFTPSATGTIAADTGLIPYVPTETTAGSPIAGILGSLSLDVSNRGDATTGGANTGTSNVTNMPIVECSIERSNGIKYFHDVVFQDHMLDFVPGDVETKVTLTFRARRDHCIWIAEHESAIATQYPIVLTCGSSAGRRMVITLPRVEFEDVEMDVPEGDEVALVKMSGQAMGSSGADEISLAFT